MRLRRPSPVFAIALAAAALVTAASPAPAPISAHDLALLNRISWGQSTSSAAQMQRIGARAWLEQQLNPKAFAPCQPRPRPRSTPCASSRTPMAELVVQMQAQTRAANQTADPDQKKTAQQAFQQAMADLGREAAARAVAARPLFAEPAARADDLVLDEPLQRLTGKANVRAHARRLRGPGDPAARAGQVPRPAGRHAAPPGDAALPGQRAERAPAGSTRTTRAS